MRHKLPALAAALLLALTLAGCGGGGAGSGASSGSTLAEGSDPVVNGPDTGSSGVQSQDSAASSGLESQEEMLQMMTVEETLEYFRRLSPADLGLEGESMEEYSFYPSEKAIPVDGLPCMKITVYDKTEVGTNTPVGTFLVARDGTAIYRLVDVQAEKLDL